MVGQLYHMGKPVEPGTRRFIELDIDPADKDDQADRAAHKRELHLKWLAANPDYFKKRYALKTEEYKATARRQGARRAARKKLRDAA